MLILRMEVFNASSSRFYITKEIDRPKLVSPQQRVSSAGGGITTLQKRPREH
jgi:hypothetical protein